MIDIPCGAAALVDDDYDDGAPLDGDLDAPNSGPAPEQTARWIDALWGNRRGWAALAYASNPYRAASGKYCHRDWIPHYYAWPAQRDALIADVTRELATGVVDVYVAPHLRSARKRTKHTALPPRFLHADIDGQVADRQLWEQVDPIRVQSGSPGHEHGYVPLTREIELPAWDLLQRALRDQLGGDADSKIADSDVLRLPGTLNFKPTVPPDGIEPGEPTPVVLLPGGGRVWDPDELAKLLGVDLTAPLRNPTQGSLGSLTAVPAPDPLPNGVITVIDRHRNNTDRSAVTHAVITACCLAGLTRTYLIFVGVYGCELRVWRGPGRCSWLRVGEGQGDGNADQLEDTPLGRGGVGDFLDVLTGEVDCFSVEFAEVVE